MPMPQFVGYSQSVLDAQKQRANIDNTLTNMAIRQQMAPLEMEQARTGIEHTKAQTEQIQAAIAKQRMVQDAIRQLGPNPNPDQLRMVGNQLQYAPFIAEADRLDALRQSKLGIATMAGRPEVTQEGPSEAPEQMGPGAPITTPSQPGVLDSLFNSPYVGKEAKALAALGQSGAPGLKATDFAMWVKNLNDKHIAETGKATARAENQAGKVEIRNMMPEPQYPVQTHVDSSGVLWEKQRGGRWEKATGPDGAPIVSSQGPETKRIVKLTTELPQARMRTGAITQNLERLTTAMQELHDDAGLSRITGSVAGRTPNLSNTATTAQAKLDSIHAQIFVDALQAMREASKTGGAVGNVSDREGDKLERTIAALSQSQSTASFKSELKKAINQINMSKARIQAAFEEQYAEVDKSAPSAAPTEPAAPTRPPLSSFDRK